MASCSTWAWSRFRKKPLRFCFDLFAAPEKEPCQISFQVSSGVLEESVPRESSPVGTYGFYSDVLSCSSYRLNGKNSFLGVVFL